MSIRLYKGNVMKSKKLKLGLSISTLLLGLFLSGCGGEPSKPSVSLNGTKWQLVNFNRSKPIGNRPITLQFNGFRMSGNSGCNRYSGLLKREGNSINLDMTKKDYDDKKNRILTTKMYCPSPAGLMDQEASYLEQLSNSRRVYVQEDTLTIKDGSDALVFKRAE